MVLPLTAKPLFFGNNSYIEYENSMDDNIRKIRQSDMIFPDSGEDTFVVVPRLDGRPPKCAEQEKTFCENFDPYPHEQLKDILEKHSVNKEFFGMDEPPEEFSSRDDEEDIFVCSSISKTIFPKIGKNKHNKWKLIVNQKEDGYVQGVRVELCRSFGKPCDVIGDAPNGYITSCRQKYIYRRETCSSGPIAADENEMILAIVLTTVKKPEPVKLVKEIRPVFFHFSWNSDSKNVWEDIRGNKEKMNHKKRREEEPDKSS
ncbi:hypothetical protein JTB14_014358 [Gonioctena quinquepunctata]|nr:hypothetical protein JTB14_014358 [Gonioctena quinquepunctata]